MREGAVALPPVLDQEFIFHVFAPLDGPAAASARQHLKELWSADDMLNLSIAFAQPVPEVRRLAHNVADEDPQARHRLGWADFAKLWDQARTPARNALLGEAHLLLARLPDRDLSAWAWSDGPLTFHLPGPGVCSCLVRRTWARSQLTK